MAKYAGSVGYATQVEVRPGSYKNIIVTKKMRGDVIRLASNTESGDKVNDDVVLNNRISLVGDPFAYSNFMNLKFIEYLNVKWKVSSVEVQRPRLICTLGGVWNDA